MDLRELIKETEKLGINIIFTSLPNCKGRHQVLAGIPIIFLDKDLNEIEAINVLLHERSHYLNNDTDNYLVHVPTASHRIEYRSEKERIIEFMSLVNEEYPIDESFNYLDYMKNSHISSRYENLVRETATEFYKENKRKKII